MKGIFRNVLLYGLSLYLTQMIFAGLIVQGGLRTYIIGGILLAVGFKILKPVLAIISLPLNIISLGLFGILIISFIMFLITLIYPSIEVVPFTFPGAFFMGIEIHKFYVSAILSYIVISGTIYLITKFINWFFDN